MSETAEPRMRLDKWLWAARFFKTRQLAAEAIQGGKVHLNGQRTKPGKTVGIGNEIEIHKDAFEWNIRVEVIPKQRRPASEAKTFYSEDEASKQKREKLTAEVRAARAAMPLQTQSKPNKKDRRLIHRFKNIHSE